MQTLIENINTVSWRPRSAIKDGYKELLGKCIFETKPLVAMIGNKPHYSGNTEIDKFFDDIRGIKFHVKRGSAFPLSWI